MSGILPIAFMRLISIAKENILEKLRLNLKTASVLISIWIVITLRYESEMTSTYFMRCRKKDLENWHQCSKFLPRLQVKLFQ